jgi:hypothetical protein
MKQVIDNNGNPIKGLYKSENGSIVVNDPDSYHKAIKEMQREKEFDLIKQKVYNMESMIVDIYNRLMQKD